MRRNRCWWPKNGAMPQTAVFMYPLWECRVDKYARVDRVRELRAKGAPDMVIALAGNKLDLEVKRAVTKEASDHTMKFVHNAVPLRSLGAGALLVHTGGTTVCGRAEASVL
jgi:hypothetical protein